jgi:hypothetical protein
MNSSWINRREFIKIAGMTIPALSLSVSGAGEPASPLPGEWFDPPREFSLAPFWFWNDTLTEAELSRQLDDFGAHGVHAFVIHPRAGLPKDTGWMSPKLLGFMRFAVEEAARRKMWVILYDEGMYPSGSSSGQVVAENPAYRTRGLFAVDLDTAKPGERAQGLLIGPDGKPAPEKGQNLIAVVPRKSDGHRIAVFDRAIRDGSSTIRGLHFKDADPPRRADHKEVPENAPSAADILNPESVQCFIRLVYQGFYGALGPHFGKTIQAIFTDEPSFLAKNAERGAVAGTTGIVQEVSRILGYDFAPHLPALWFDNEPDAARYRADYNRALRVRLEETFYEPISRWCSEHNVALAGHPEKPDDIGNLKWFQIPGQDIVWRYIEPGKPSALEGAQSTQAKCAASAMVHLGRRRNANEFCGAYGPEMTFEEMQWLAGWLLVRGCNMLIPHAFYYSIRGPRIDERPPDVGPNSPWWDRFAPFAKACARGCWLNTDSRPVCRIAILGQSDRLPWRAAGVCFENQRDFHYLSIDDLQSKAVVDDKGIHIAGMDYSVLIIEPEFQIGDPATAQKLRQSGRLFEFGSDDPAGLIAYLDRMAPPEVQLDSPCPGLRVRHVQKNGMDLFILFNELTTPSEIFLSLSIPGPAWIMDPVTARLDLWDRKSPLRLASGEWKTVAISPKLPMKG